MALNIRDILVVVRARDVASRVFREVGSNITSIGSTSELSASKVLGLSAALTGAGTVLAGAGAIGISFFNDATQAAVDYQAQVARTFTQVGDKVHVTFEDLNQMGKDIAANIPVPFNQTQEVLYDIFSSIDASLSEAQTLAEAIAKGSVAGVADLNQVGEATIAILNSLSIPISDVNDVMDFQFQLVRRGILTYDELTQNIGKILPSAQMAGAGLDDIGGALAFITRSIPNVAMASTSLARAFELVANPKVVDRLHAMGIEAVDASGNFRPFTDVIAELGNKLDDLPEAERAAAIFDLIQGAGGTIQARRFLVEAISNWQDLVNLTGDMSNRAGAMDEAYQIMFEQPQSQIQQLTNQYEILKEEIGEELIPVKLHLLRIVQSLLDWWNSLSEGTQSLIVKIGLFASIIAVVIGVVLVVAGVILGLVAILMTLGLTFGGAIAVIGGVIVGIIALGAAIIAIVMHWDTLKNAAGAAWDFIKEKSAVVWTFLQGIWDSITEAGVEAWHTIQAVWDEVSSFFVDSWADFQAAWDILTAGIIAGWQAVVDAWHNNKFIQDTRDIVVQLVGEIMDIIAELGETVQQIGGWFTGAAGVAQTALEPVVQQLQAFLLIVWGIMQTVGQIVKGGTEFIFGQLQALWHMIGPLVLGALNIVKEIIDFVLDIIVGLWNRWGDNILSILESTWDFIVQIVKGAIDIVAGLIKTVLNVIQGDWGEAWKSILQVFSGVWRIIKGTLEFTLDLIRNAIGMTLDAIRALWDASWELVKDTVTEVWNAVFRTIENTGENIINWFRTLPENLKEIFDGAVSWLSNAGKDILQGLWDGLKAIWNTLWAWFVTLPMRMIESILGFFGIHSPSTVMRDIGMDIIRGWWDGMVYVWGGLWNWFSSLPNVMLGLFLNAAVWLVNKGHDIVQGLWNGLVAIWDQLWAWFSQAPTTFINLFANALDLLFTAGWNLVQGLWNGISDRWEDFKDWFDDKIGGIASAVSNIFHLGSPSKLMYDYGQDIMRGFEMGLASGAANVDATFRAATTLTPVNGTILAAPAGGNTLVMEEGAVQINVGSGDPEEIKDAIEEAFRDIIDDWDGR